MSSQDFREALLSANKAQAKAFLDGDSVVDLVHARATSVDEVLTQLWHQHVDSSDVSLLAVGGYGRGELHPASDVDIMLLCADTLPDACTESIARFVAAMWDIGLDVGHSVRTVAQCQEEAANDLTIATTLMEARLLTGPLKLFDAMQVEIHPDRMWPSARFFEEKRKEQRERHHRYHDTAYNLEPNVKSSPGGLRDIQIIGWVAKRHFGAATLAELVDYGFLTPGQLVRLQQGEHFLWRIRFALHVLTGRREDRLLFDHQTRLAEMLGYEDASYTLAVEQLMQRYYRTVMDLSRLNEILLQQFEEAILMDPNAPSEPLDERFEVKNGFLKTVDEETFAHYPSALLELFLRLQQHPELRGVSAYTVGSVKRHLHLIDDEFRQNPRNHRLFLEILRAPEGVTHELRRMNLYGVLGLYIPAFGRIVGRMQYDLFHAYTVDEHTLFVVSNLRRFALRRFDHEFPHCSEVMQQLEKPEIAYLGGLFHDIAKGRGGDHSELGAVDAAAFCLEHGLSDDDAETVSWLVRQHLIFSSTAQKKDLGDPDVINEFAEAVGNIDRLNYLYVLTVADVRGTDPKLWNSWKSQLFRDLYELCKRALSRGLENPFESKQLIREKKQKARDYLQAAGLSESATNAVWTIFDDNYFLRYRSSEIAWHTEWLANAGTHDEPGLVDTHRRRTGDGLQAVLYTRQTRHTFAHVTAVLAQMGLTIVDARLVPLPNGYSIDTYVFMESDERVEIDQRRIDKVHLALCEVVTTDDNEIVPVTRTVTRQAKHFSTPTKISFSAAPTDDQLVLELTTADRPGLLSAVGRVFLKLGIDIKSAKIMTIGERAEDVFYISDLSGQPLSDNIRDQLASTLFKQLGENQSID